MQIQPKTTHSAVRGSGKMPEAGGSCANVRVTARRRRVPTALCIGVAATVTVAAISHPFRVRAAQDASATSYADISQTSNLPSTGDDGIIAPIDRDHLLIPSTPVLVTVADGRSTVESDYVSARTVGDALTGMHVALNDLDRVSPDIRSNILPGERITVTRVVVQDETRTLPIPFHTTFVMRDTIPAGTITGGQAGKPGVMAERYAVTYVNDQPVSYRLLSKTVAQAPVDAETFAGIRIRMAEALPSRSGSYIREQCMEMVATGYSPYEGSGTGRCATGMRAGYGVVAVDPRVIPLGTRLYIEGYGYAVAGDTGGAIRGHRIDLGHTTHREADSVGRRHVRVWILSSY